MRKFACVLALCLASSAANAMEFLSVKNASAVMFDAPDASSKKLFVVGFGYPVESLNDAGAWLRVRDAAGSITWMQRADLAKKRTLLVTVPRVDVRQTASETAPVVFSVTRDVWLEWQAAPNAGWVKVHHPQDGAQGFAPMQAFWGL